MLIVIFTFFLILYKLRLGSSQPVASTRRQISNSSICTSSIVRIGWSVYIVYTVQAGQAGKESIELVEKGEEPVEED